MMIQARHDKKTRTCAYPTEFVLILTGNTRVDRVWVRVFPNNQKSGMGTCIRLLHLSRLRSRTRPAT